MKRLLIAEDEKMIRQGLRAIIQRSQVPIDEILECRNGEEALEIMRSTPVDVLFTDIRMPKMDGLTMLRTLQEATDWPWPKPEIVVVSGHGEFNYAVEAMRYGTREYILKPIRRERVHEILEKLDKLILQRQEKERQRQQLEKLGHQHIKYALVNPGLSPAELDTIQNALQDLFAFDSYIMLCTNRDAVLTDEDVAFQVESGEIFRTLVVSASAYKNFIAQKLASCYVGASPVYSEMSEFRTAFVEAVKARKCAFFIGKRFVDASDITYCSTEYCCNKSPENLARHIGSKQYSELVHLLDRLHKQAACDALHPAAFEEFILNFLEAVEQMFRQQIIEEDLPALQRLKEIYGYDTIDAYRIALFEWLDTINLRVFHQIESHYGKDRIQKALDYIGENYDKNLNMAMVSNHVSMNYSVFSKMFKEQTEKSFVEYLRGLRIEKAKELLVTTPLKISEISDRVGFDNDKYFIKSFKSLVGVSPSQYRKVEQINNLGN